MLLLQLLTLQRRVSFYTWLVPLSISCSSTNPRGWIRKLHQSSQVPLSRSATLALEMASTVCFCPRRRCTHSSFLTVTASAKLPAWKKILLMVCFKSCPVSSSFLQESHICLCHIASTTKLHMKTHLCIYTISRELEMSISNHMNTSSCSYRETYPVKRRQWALGLFLHGWLFSLFFFVSVGVRLCCFGWFPIHTQFLFYLLQAVRFLAV